MSSPNKRATVGVNRPTGIFTSHGALHIHQGWQQTRVTRNFCCCMRKNAPIISLAAHLAFYWEQLQLVQQVLDLTNQVYEDTNKDDNPEGEQFCQIWDQCIKWLGHWRWLVELSAIPEGAHQKLQQAQAYRGDITHLWRFANSALQDLQMWPNEFNHTPSPCWRNSRGF